MFVTCSELAEGKIVKIGDIYFVGTKQNDKPKEKESA